MRTCDTISKSRPSGLNGSERQWTPFDMFSSSLGCQSINRHYSPCLTVSPTYSHRSIGSTTGGTTYAPASNLNKLVPHIHLPDPTILGIQPDPYYGRLQGRVRQGHHDQAASFQSLWRFHQNHAICTRKNDEVVTKAAPMCLKGWCRTHLVCTPY